MTIRSVDVAMFIAECGCYVAIGMLGWRLHPLVGVMAVLAMAMWWGTLHSPKATIHLAAAWDAALRITWFAIGAVAAMEVGWIVATRTRA